MRDVDKVVIHYSATPPDMKVTAEDIKRWHQERNFSVAPGYHKIVLQDGTVQDGGVPYPKPGIHVRGHNKNTIGICYIGGLAPDGVTGYDSRTPEQIEAIDRLIEEIRAEINPDVEVVGHKDLDATQCPGYDVKTDMRLRNAEPELEEVTLPFRRLDKYESKEVQVLHERARKAGVDDEDFIEMCKVFAVYLDKVLMEVPWYRRAVTVIKTIRDVLSSVSRLE